MRLPAQVDAKAETARVAGVVRRVIADTLHEAGASGIVVLDDWTPEGELVYEWLVLELGEARVWRAAHADANVHGEARTWRTADDDAPLLAHPANRTALLLGGRPPLADLLPLGDVWASQVLVMAGRWSAPASVETLARHAGGVAVLDHALARMLDERRAPDEALAGLEPDVARRLLHLYERGRHGRRYPRVVPKLSARTLGIDLFD